MPAKKVATAKKAPARKPAARKSGSRLDKGSVLECGVCGLTVVVDEVCGCEEVHEIICCEEPMKARKPRARAKAAA
jgi:hypothetical protein